MREEIRVKDAIRIEARYEDFDGNLDKWKDSFYQLWRLQLTWGFAHRITLNETKRGVFVCLLVKPVFRDNAVETMDGFGYKNIRTYHENIGEIEYPSDKLLDLGIEEVEIDY